MSEADGGSTGRDDSRVPSPLSATGDTVEEVTEVKVVPFKNPLYEVSKPNAKLIFLSNCRNWTWVCSHITLVWLQQII